MSAPSILTLAAIREAAIEEAQGRDAARAAGRPLGPELARFSPALASCFDVGGFPHVGFGLLHGRSGAAKTAAATAIARTCGVPAIIVETEMRAVRILERLTAAHSGAYIGQFVNGELSANDIADLMADAIADAPLLAMIDATTSTVSAAEIAAAAAQWRARHEADHVLVVLDSLQSWSARALANVRDEYPRTNLATDQIMIAAEKAEVFFLIISERSNANTDSADTASGKGSGRPGYAGEVTLALDRAGEYDPATGLTPLNVFIPKNRWGKQGVTVPLFFEGRTQRFSDADEPHKRKGTRKSKTVSSDDGTLCRDETAENAREIGRAKPLDFMEVPDDQNPF